jgi:hypothetical protein
MKESVLLGGGGVRGMLALGPGAVVQRAMPHTSPKSKRRYQLGMTDQVCQAVEKANKKRTGRNGYYVFMTFCPRPKKGGKNRNL